MKTTIIISCYNESKTIVSLLNKVINLNIDKEVIVVDDGSTDGSKDLLNKYFTNKVDKIIYQENKGKGYSIRQGIKYSHGDIIIPQDADLELDPNDIIKVINPILIGDAKVTIGTRFSNGLKGSFLFKLGNKLINHIANKKFKQNLSDTNCCYIAIKKEILNSITLIEDDFTFNQEIIGKISNLGIKIKEISISYNPRIKKDGKKIRYRDGLKAIKAINKYRVRN